MGWRVLPVGYQLFFLLFYLYDWFCYGTQGQRAQRGLVIFGGGLVVCLLPFVWTRYWESDR